MAIKVVLKRKAEYPDLALEVQTRIDIALYILQEYLTFFVPRKLVAWLNAPMEEIGGQKIKEVDLIIGDSRQIFPYIKGIIDSSRNKQGIYANSIFRIEGRWTLGDKQADGFFSINNDYEWRTAYGDIDIDGYPSGQYDDFLEMFWEDEGIRTEVINKMFDNFIKRYWQRKSLTDVFDLQWICFANGVPSDSEVPAMKAVYYDSEKSLVLDMFKTYIQENREDVPKSIQRGYLVNKSFKSPLFREEMKEMIASCKVSKLEGGSIMLVGNKSDSFKELYSRFAKNYLQPLYTELPSDLEIDGKIGHVIRKNTDPSQQSLNDVFEPDESEKD